MLFRSNFVIQALCNRDITVYGSGEQTRSFCYVDDLVEGLLRLMETPNEITGPVNLGNPAEFTILQLAEAVIALTGSSAKIVHRPLPDDDPRQRCPDISQAQELLGWAPRVHQWKRPACASSMVAGTLFSKARHPRNRTRLLSRFLATQRTAAALQRV